MRCYWFSAIFSSVILAVVLCHHGISGAGDGKATNTVSVDVYYESLCPDSMRFIKDQLVPTFKILEDYFTVTLIPYGKANHKLDESTQKWQFTCQHGNDECLGNKAQACAINVIKNSTNALDANQRQYVVVSLIGCVMSEDYPATAVQQCSKRINLSDQTLTRISECEKSVDGDLALVENGEKTKALQPTLAFVPTIVINKVFTEENQKDSQTNLKLVVCRNIKGQKPAIC